MEKVAENRFRFVVGNEHLYRRMTIREAARIQGFPDDWFFGEKKTTACRMIGNAFPPPVAKAVGSEITKILDYGSSHITSPEGLSQAFA